MIYLDHNATTPVDERVIEAMMPYFNQFYGNPSSLYRAGRVVRSAVDVAREQVAALVDAQPAQIIFTSGGTEANNLALKAVGANSRIAVSATEHPSVLESVKKNRDETGWVTIPVDSQGLITQVDVDKNVNLVSIMLANNETGVIQNLEKIGQLLNDKHILLHTDAIQAVGKVPVSFTQLGVDLMSLSSHKIYGPKGCGALVIKKGLIIENPLLVGGGQENTLRAGTENTAAIVGFGKAAEIARQELSDRSSYYLKLRKLLEQELKTIPSLVIFAEQVERLPNTVQFGIKNIDGEMLLMQLDQKNIAVSSGSACSSGGGKASSVLVAMGVEFSVAKSAIRVSLGKMNTEVEIMKFIKILKSIVTTSRA
jgi:cysteine desulfurase